MAKAAGSPKRYGEKPYSVILLDEVEKAHPDVHEIFFQVFDKASWKNVTAGASTSRTPCHPHHHVGSELIMELSRDPKYRDDPEQLGFRLRQNCSQV